ncbi:MAG: hypothetical protein QXK80_02050 [Candidatus Pacearchaeota archaeon]
MKIHSMNLKTLLFLAFFPAIALTQNIENTISIGSNVQYNQEQIEQKRWFSKGDMYEWRDKKAPLRIIVCKDDSFSEHLLKDYDSLFIVRDDSIYEARTFKNGQEWYPGYKADKKYLERITDDYLKGWLEQTNYWLSYLSGGKFQLELEGIDYISIDYWNDDNYWKNFNYGKAFTMIVHPSGGVMPGYYSGSGIFWIDPLSLTYDKNDKNKCTLVPIHEILHGFFGPGHSPDSLSTIFSPSSHIYLTQEEAKFLKWPQVKPRKLEKVNL